MLHILWLIVKAILILVGIVLGLLLVACLLLLFCPVCYQGEVSYREKEIAARGKITWLFRAIGFAVSYSSGKPEVDVRLFGLSLKKLRRFFQKKKRTSSGKKAPKKKELEIPEEQPPVIVPREQQEEAAAQALPEEETREKKEKSVEGAPPAQKKHKEAENTQTDESQQKKRTFPGTEISSRIGVFYEKMQGQYKKIQGWKEFLQEPSTGNALALVWNRCRRILGHVAPRRLKGQVLFGFEDPSKTGMILAILGMTVPIHKNRVAIFPVYDRQILEGEVWAGGRIYAVVFVYAALRVWFDQNIKDVRKRWKQKEVTTAYGE